MTTQPDAKGIRKQVSDDYAKHVSRPAESSCCGPTPKGVAAKLAGYSTAELSAIPKEAAVNSFGCGNPVALAVVKPGQTVLDLGSGAGIDLILAAQKVGPTGRVIGIDMTDAMISKARENIAAAGLTNVEVRKGIIEELPVESSSVDLVISNCVINLSPEKTRVFREIARVLKPGGTISISDIVAEEIPGELRTHKILYSSCVAGAISEKNYINGLMEAGLADVKVVDRLIYDKTHLTGLIGSDAIGETSGGCCGSTIPKSEAIEWATKMAGKVASVRVTARR